VKIVGVLSWYDESPGWLATAVTGFARVCDEIVAVDGSYALLPGARPCSIPDQAEAILGAAEAAGVACTLHRPNDLFYGNEVQKRNLTVRLAGAGCAIGDWLMVFDADCHMFKCNPSRVRGELEKTECLIASYTVLDYDDYLSDQDLADLVKKDDFQTEWTIRTRDIYRYHPTLMYGPQHWMVSREIDGERKWLRHSSPDVLDCHDLDASLVCYHRSKDRAWIRREAQRQYYATRDLHGVEAVKPGDPVTNGLPELERSSA
jgi:hypothetical protein